MASIFGAILIALLPYPSSFICGVREKALGMPIFPVFALTYLWTYALPLVSNHPKIITYFPEDIFC